MGIEPWDPMRNPPANPMETVILRVPHVEPQGIHHAVTGESHGVPEGPPGRPPGAPHGITAPPLPTAWHIPWCIVEHPIGYDGVPHRLRRGTSWVRRDAHYTLSVNTMTCGMVSPMGYPTPHVQHHGNCTPTGISPWNPIRETAANSMKTMTFHVPHGVPRSAPWVAWPVKYTMGVRIPLAASRIILSHRRTDTPRHQRLFKRPTPWVATGHTMAYRGTYIPWFMDFLRGLPWCKTGFPTLIMSTARPI